MMYRHQSIKFVHGYVMVREKKSELTYYGRNWDILNLANLLHKT
jgi:hypothetical protein